MAVFSKMVEEPVTQDHPLPDTDANTEFLKLGETQKASGKTIPDSPYPIYRDRRLQDLREPDPVVPCCSQYEWYYGYRSHSSDISAKLRDLREPEDVLPISRNDLFPPYPYGRAEEFKRLCTRDPSGQNSPVPCSFRRLHPISRRFRLNPPSSSFAAAAQLQNTAHGKGTQFPIPGFVDVLGETFDSHRF